MPRHVSLAGAFLLSWGASSLCSAQTQVGPREYALSLLQNEVPVGVVVPNELLQQGKWMPRPETTPASRAAFRTGLASSLDTFNAAKGMFRATQQEGVVHVRGLDEPVEVTSALGRYANVEQALGLPALAAVFQRGVAAMRGYGPMAVLGSGPSPTQGPDCLLDTPVNVVEGPTTAIALLDRIVRQAPGVAWVVTYRRDSPGQRLQVNVGLLCANGAHAKISVFR